MQPLTRGPEADETKTMTVTLPHRVQEVGRERLSTEAELGHGLVYV